MKTIQYFIDDTPLQILFLDNDIVDGRSFFANGLGSTWFDYDLHMIDEIDDANSFLQTNGSTTRNIDLLLISNSIWPNGGESFVRDLRSKQAFSALPIYCVVSCEKKNTTPNPQCWNEEWRKKTDCNNDAQIARIPYKQFSSSNHPARIDGTLCANDISSELPHIVDQLTTYWFRASSK